MKRVGYIIKSHNKYDGWDRAHAQYKFILNDGWYAIYTVDIIDNLPILATTIEDQYPEEFHIYKSFEAAIEFVRLM